MSQPRIITPAVARRLAISRQRLAGSAPAPDRDGIMEVVRDIGCLQLDPISVVARSHQLVLWSRLGAYDLAELDALLWEERRLFEYWAHAASIVLTEDYPIHRWLMRRYPRATYSHGRRTLQWLEENKALRRHVLLQIRRRGPVRIGDLEDRSQQAWRSGGWTTERNVARMLDVLWTQGKVMVARRRGLEKFWDLAERILPNWTPREHLTDLQVTRRAAQRSLRALGVGTVRHVKNHFTAGRYPGLTRVVSELEREGRVQRVEVADDVRPYPDEWFVHSEDLPLLERIEAGEWDPRTTLLSPFDNLITARDRTELLFEFRFRTEIYVPRAKRLFGYYLLPILHGDKLIGRVDAAMDRKGNRLLVKAVHVEPEAPNDRESKRAVADALEDLAGFLGADDLELPGATRAPWLSSRAGRLRTRP